MARPRILFVCDNNLVRSPLVAAVVEKLAGGELRCESSGVFVTSIGREVDRRLLRAAASKEIDLSQHKTSSIEPIELSDFFGIVSLDNESYFYLDRKRGGDKRPHIFAFSEFVEGLHLSEVPDPITGDISFEDLIDLVWDPCRRITEKFLKMK
jgi:protein-tyrosine-phosphatase